MSSRCNNCELLQIAARTLTFVDGYACEGHVLANTTGLTFDGQDIPFLRGADIRDVDVRAEPCLLEAGAGDCHAASPVHDRGGDGAVEGVFGIYVVGADGEMGDHGAFLRGYDLDVCEEEVVDWGALTNSRPAGIDAFERHLLGLGGTHDFKWSGPRQRDPGGGKTVKKTPRKRCDC